MAIYFVSYVKHELVLNLKSLFYKLYFSFYFKSIKWGKNIQIHGIFLININKKSKVYFGDNIVFRSNTKSNFAGISKPVSIAVGEGGVLYIGNYTGFSGTSIYVTSKITIGDYCNFGVNTSIWDTDFHPLDFKERRVNNVNKTTNKPIVIGNDVFVGANSIILKGVTIGDRSIIGAGSIVNKNIPNDEIWAGNPAKFIRKL